MAVALIAARTLALSEFGAFSLVYASYVIFQGMTRGLLSEVLMVVEGGRPLPSTRLAAARVSGASLWLGLTAGTVVIAATPILPSRGIQIAIVAVTLPGLALQDTWRYVFFVRGEAWKACLNDTLWLVLCVAPYLLFRQAVTTSGEMEFAVYGATATVCAAFGRLQHGYRITLDPRDVFGWLREHWYFSWRYCAEFLIGGGSQQASSFTITLATSASAFGAVRGAQLFFGPIRTLIMGFQTATIPHLAGLGRLGRRRTISRSVGMMAILLAASVSVWTFAALLIPPSWGRLLAGNAFTAGRPLLIATGVGWIGTVVAASCTAGVRGLSDARRSLRARLFGGPMLIVGPTAGAYLNGAPGAAVGQAIGSMGAAVVWLLAYGRAVSSRPADTRSHGANAFRLEPSMQAELRDLEEG